MFELNTVPGVIFSVSLVALISLLIIFFSFIMKKGKPKTKKANQKDSKKDAEIELLEIEQEKADRMKKIGKTKKEAMKDIEEAMEKEIKLFEKTINPNEEKELFKTIFPLNFWVIFFLISGFLALITMVVISAYSNSILGILAGVSFFIIMSILAIAKSWTTLPQNHHMLVEVFGEYKGTWKKPGLKFPFPFFGFVSLKQDFMGEQRVPLFRYHDENGEEKIMIFDLNDASLPIIAEMFVEIDNLYKATYSHGESMKGAVKYVEAFIRRIMAEEKADTLEEALGLRSSELIKQFKDEKSADGDTTYKHILNDLGVKVLEIKLHDFLLNDEQRAHLDEVLKAKKLGEAMVIKAEMDAKAAIREKERKITLSEGEAKAIKNMASAEKARMQKMSEWYEDVVKGGSNPEPMLNHLQNIKMAENQNMVHITGGGNKPSDFATIGAVMSAGKNAFDKKIIKGDKE